MNKWKDVKKVVLAYSGGLDTSIILKWLQTELGAEVVTFTADLGQGERAGAGAQEGRDARHQGNLHRATCARNSCAISSSRCSAPTPSMKGVYLLGTSIARPLISKHLVEIARETGADAIAHGATGKGNDQVRFELSAYALNPDIKVIAPWRDWSFKIAHRSPRISPRSTRSRSPRTSRARRRSRSTPTFCTPPPRARCWRTRGSEPPEYRASAHHLADGRAGQGDRDHDRLQEGRRRSRSNGKALSPATLLAALNDLGRDNGIGRLDLVENRFVGMKSRGVYETPGGTILLAAHRAIESITLDRGAAHLKDELMPRYAELIYNGFWFSPEREMLQALIDKSQEDVEGEVRLKLYKGNVMVTGRKSPKIALFRRAGHLRGRPRRLRPEGCRGLHPPQCAAAAHARRAQAQELSVAMAVRAVGSRADRSGPGRAGRGGRFRSGGTRSRRAHRMQGGHQGLQRICDLADGASLTLPASSAGRRCRPTIPSSRNIGWPRRSRCSAMQTSNIAFTATGPMAVLDDISPRGRWQSSLG